MAPFTDDRTVVRSQEIIIVEAFSEAVARTVGSQLRQGDVLEAVDPNASIWTRHLLVVTADCDFANKKNSGRVSCVPLLDADQYLLQFFFPTLRQRVLDRLVRESRDLLRRRGRPLVSADRLVEWVQEVEDVSAISRALEMGGADLRNFERKIESVKRICLPPSSLEEALMNLLSAQETFDKAGARDKMAIEMRSALLNRYASTPGDAMFLSSIAPGYQEGYFAYFRHIEQVWQERVRISPSREDFSYRRIGGLSDRYTHAAVQKFALVFMPIGLPPEYESLRETHAQVLSGMVH